MYVNIVKSEAYAYIWNVEKSEINRCLIAQRIRKVSHCDASQNPGNIRLTSPRHWVLLMCLVSECGTWITVQNWLEDT